MGWEAEGASWWVAGVAAADVEGVARPSANATPKATCFPKALARGRTETGRGPTATNASMVGKERWNGGERGMGSV